MVLSLKTWKSRSLPGLPRSETSSRSRICEAKASHGNKKPPRHCRGGFLHSRIARSKRVFCRPCLDWSERRYHVAGLVGAEIWRRSLELGWFKRNRDTRALRLTAVGKAGLFETFGADLTNERPGSSNRSALPPRIAEMARSDIRD